VKKITVFFRKIKVFIPFLQIVILLSPLLMTVQEAKQELKILMTQLYDASEARNIVRYIFDDYLMSGISSSANPTLDIISAYQYADVKEKLLQKMPVQYVVGFAWFYGIKLKVNNTVLIPRPETEELVEWILEDTKTTVLDKKSVLDIGTGSGCIPIVLALKNPNLKLFALDVSESALITASRNAFRHGAEIDFLLADILEASAQKKLPLFDIIVSNPPYITESEKVLMDKNVLDFEPASALFVSDNAPLVFYEKIADFAQTHLNENGNLYFECNSLYAQTVKNMLEAKHFSEVVLRKDMSGKDRLIRATLTMHLK
jgi:release factor glutamine methyltransferase